MAFWRDFEVLTYRKCSGADACFLRKYVLWRARSAAWSSSVFLQFETRGPGVGAGTPDERDRNRVSVSKSICHSEFPESTRARASAQGSVHSESASAGQFLLRKVKNRAVGEPFSVAFAALSHCDNVLDEDCAASG